ncbi:CDF family Co(II)/Ni(II) efflux transporter DmeF [Devosia sp. A449]
MAFETATAGQHSHVFLGDDHDRNARRTWWVIALTAAMMLGEIAAGAAFGSLALLADGFHMATHAGALTIAAVAYMYARRHADDERFTFGTGKLGELAGYTSAVILAVVAVMIGFECIVRLTNPIAIRFDEAIAVAVVGLLVNIASVFLLHDSGHSHDHGHAHSHAGYSHAGHAHDDHDHDHSHDVSANAPKTATTDFNLRAAYFHVLADALTSVLAIVGLVAGRNFGWLWMDPAVGLLGSIVIARWSWQLLRGAGAVLLDRVPDDGTADQVRSVLELGSDEVSDLHLWRVGPGHLALIVSVISENPRPATWYKAKLASIAELSHITVEVLKR